MDNIKRVILKLSGEALAKKEGGYNDELIENIANQVKTIVDKGTDVGVVIGVVTTGEAVLMIISTELRLTR